MMGPSHSLSGAAVWLAGSLCLDQFAHYHQSPIQLAVGTAMCAGGALLPDMDLAGRVLANRGGATVAHTFGALSLFVAEVIEKLSIGVYAATRLPRDPHRDNGHRTLTHTLLFNVAAGFGASLLCQRYGKPAVIGTLFVTFAMALRGLFEKWAKRAGWIVITILSAVSAFAAYERLPGGRGYPLLGIALGVGGIVHLFGDLLTRHGCPLLWPIPIGRWQLWRCIGLPDALTFKVGGNGEVYLLRTLSVVVIIGAVGLLVAPSLHWY